MPIVSQGNSVVVDVGAHDGLWIKSTGSAEVTINQTYAGTPEVINVTTETVRVGFYGEPVTVSIRAVSGSADYQDAPYAYGKLTATQQGDRSDSSALDIAQAVNNLQSGTVGFDAITLKGLPDTPSAPAGYGDLASAVNSVGVIQQQTVVLFGDSYAESQNFPIVSGNTTFFSLYRFILGRMGNAIRVVKNAGISGQRANQMLARIDADVLAFPSDWVFFNCGVNDFFEGDRSVADVIADVTQILSKLTEAGRKVLVFACPPQVSTRSGFSISKSTRVVQYNRWLAGYAATLHGVVVADIYSPLVNWSDTTNGGAIADCFASDGIHLSTYGEIVVVQAALTALNGAIGADLSLFNGPLDLGAIGTKALLVGTTGTNGTASSGQVATGYTSQRTSGTNGTIVASKISPRGQRQTITLVPTNGEIRLRLWSDILADITPFLGKTFRTQVLMRLRTVSGGVSLKDFSIRLNNIANSVTTEAANGNYPTNVYSPITDTQFDTGVILLTLRDLAMPVGSTQAQLLFGLLLDSVAGGVVELDIYGVDIREVV